MLLLSLLTPSESCAKIATRAKARRVALGLTQAELARRTGIALPTLRVFEQSGQVSLERLLRIANVLGVLASFDDAFPAPISLTMDDLDTMKKNTRRKYGRSTEQQRKSSI